MKPIFKFMHIFVTALFIVSVIGCGADDEKDTADVMLDFVDTTWQIGTIDGAKFEDLFTLQDPEPEFETESMLAANSWVFNADGSFTGALEFILTEKYSDPVSSMTQKITITSEGTYTANDSTLTITKSDLKVDVVVTLEPKAVWEQQIQGKTVEELQNDFAEETKRGFGSTASAVLFKEGVGYTWSLAGDTLTLSKGNQKIALERKSK